MKAPKYSALPDLSVFLGDVIRQHDADASRAAGTWTGTESRDRVAKFREIKQLVDLTVKYNDAERYSVRLRAVEDLEQGIACLRLEVRPPELLTATPEDVRVEVQAVVYKAACEVDQVLQRHADGLARAKRIATREVRP